MTVTADMVAGLGRLIGAFVSGAGAAPTSDRTPAAAVSDHVRPLMPLTLHPDGVTVKAMGMSRMEVVDPWVVEMRSVVRASRWMDAAVSSSTSKAVTLAEVVNRSATRTGPGAACGEEFN
jgi:hypothetical protein